MYLYSCTFQITCLELNPMCGFVVLFYLNNIALSHVANQKRLHTLIQNHIYSRKTSEVNEGTWLRAVYSLRNEFQKLMEHFLLIWLIWLLSYFYSGQSDIYISVCIYITIYIMPSLPISPITSTLRWLDCEREWLKSPSWLLCLWRGTRIHSPSVSSLAS